MSVNLGHDDGLGEEREDGRMEQVQTVRPNGPLTLYSHVLTQTRDSSRLGGAASVWTLVVLEEAWTLCTFTTLEVCVCVQK